MNNPNNNRFQPGLIILMTAGIAVFLMLQKQESMSPHIENWAEGWREVSGFQIPRRAPAAVISGHFIYVLGGVDDKGEYVHTVEYSPIEPNGDLKKWEKTSGLREGRFYLGAASDGKYLYALGGGGGPIGDDNVPLASVERARILSDGSLGDWQHHSYLTTPRRGLKVERVNGHLYAIGGYNGQFLRSTEHFNIDSGSRWVLDKSEAQVDRYIHATAQVKNRLYLLGGHVEKAGAMSYGDIETTRVHKSGNLESWEVLPSRLIDARFIATAFSLGKYLYIAGGHNGIQRLNSIEMTSISRSGEVRKWQLLNPMTYKRSAAASAVVGERVYILGGMDDNGVLNSVETAILGPQGRLGHITH